MHVYLMLGAVDPLLEQGVDGNVAACMNVSTSAERRGSYFEGELKGEGM